MSEMININFKEYFTDQIKNRYAEPIGMDRYRSSTIPYLFTNHKVDSNSEYNRVMTPNLLSLARSVGMRPGLVTFNTMLDRTKIDIEKVNSDIRKIESMNDLEIVSIGYGGFSINVIHFMYLLGVQIGKTHWIKKLTIYESDNISLSNSFRIYKDMSKITQKTSPSHKFDLINNDSNICKELNLNHIRFSRPIKDDGFPTRRFYFGAPDFDTRKLMENQPFIFTGHSGNEVEFYGRPIVDSDLTRETYGKIHLDYFFMNILKSAEKLIDIFANNNPNDIPKDSLIFKYNHKEEGSL